ncbi:hypothetical protein IVB69_00015 [Flavobacterium sp. J49]|uniref:hypothetical protein n=1 Tax=Flavobacterium sp. J49 TaxID=2718534 RepID=UPI0015946D12|nr:hypothetical protein [Flavobacterium sp. J49]MBF6639852.1 hypothetical protein [Flavobacterium sp. J49]NIC01093.1 hypothetical protein [Flavobacterium sp. J49]
MNDIFLNSKLKLYYMKDFEKLLQDERDFWKIDNEFLKEILKEINSNSKVQTLYSKYGEQKLLGSESYLQFAFSKDVQDKIFRLLIPNLLFTYNYDFKSYCYYEYREPSKNNNYKLEREKFGFNCVDDENYFMINSIKIYLKTRDNIIKEKFWKDLEKMLKEL